MNTMTSRNQWNRINRGYQDDVGSESPPPPRLPETAHPPRFRRQVELLLNML
jgi:hypothetical protein